MLTLLGWWLVGGEWWVASLGASFLEIYLTRQTSDPSLQRSIRLLS